MAEKRYLGEDGVARLAANIIYNFSPKNHNHTIADIDELQSNLNTIQSSINGIDDVVSELDNTVSNIDARVESLESYTQEPIEFVQSDWNVNDPDSDSYVQNRPFYTGDPVETPLVDNITFETQNYNGLGMASNPFALELTEGAEYVVTWNGVEYTTTCTVMDGLLAIGNGSIFGMGEDTGEPFLIGYAGYIMLYATSFGTVTINIVGRVPEIYQIDNKYIDFPNGSYVGELTDVGEIFNDYENNIASGSYSHAEGAYTEASGHWSHAEGYHAKAYARWSHAEGCATKARGEAQHVQGKYNVEDNGNKYAHIVGNGSSSRASNAHTVDWYGNAWYQGTIKIGGENQDDANALEVATQSYVDTAMEDIASIKIKAGVIYPYTGEIAPEGFLLCNGQEVSRETYAELFAVIGTTYGIGDGSSTFNVPDLQGRTFVGAGDSFALGATGGEASHVLTIDEMPSHSHALAYPTGWTDGTANAQNSGYYDWSSNYNTSNSDMWNQNTVANGGGQEHNNMQPYAVVNYIISTGENTGVSVSEIIEGVQALPLGIEYGGTGATNASNARQNLNMLGLNPIGAVQIEGTSVPTVIDSPSDWVALGTGVAWFDSNSLLSGKPTDEGFVVNKVYDSQVHQEWHSVGEIPRVWSRSGSGSSWDSEWKQNTLPVCTATGASGATVTLSNTSVTGIPLTQFTVNTSADHYAINSDGGITINKAGYYKVTGSIYFRSIGTNAIGNAQGVYLMRNHGGTTTEIGSCVRVGQSATAMNATSKIIECSRGDIIYLRARNTGASGCVASCDNVSTFLTIEQV